MIPEIDLRMLAYGLKDEQVLLAMTGAVTEDYLHPHAQALWTLTRRCFERYKEVPTERVLMKTAGQEAWEGGLSDLYRQAMEVGIDHREYPSDLEDLKRRHNEQILRRAGEAVYKNNFNGRGFNDLSEANKVLKDAMASIDQLYAKEVFKEGALDETAPDAWRDYQRIKANPEDASGIHLGFSEIDRITNGLRPAELMLIGGESGTGKSAFTMNMCINAWLGDNKPPTTLDEEIGDFSKGRSIVYFTIEMPFEVMQRRLHAAVAGVSLYGIRDGTLGPEEEERYRAALRFIRAYPYPFYVVDIPRGATMRHVEVKYLELCRKYEKHPPELFGLDYISLMTPEVDQGSDWLNLGKLAEQAHEFCRVQNLPGISPVQLNRPPKKGSDVWDRPDQDRIGRSVMLTQNANIVLTIEKRKDEHLMRDMRVHIIKMRDGEQGMFTLQKRLNIMRLYDSMDGWEPQVYEAAQKGPSQARLNRSMIG